ncbi:MAG: hypothetical protein IKA76_07055 [Clostridia bacterium]|nr:hypothetical protein [Clostridia bacterium]
MNRNIEEAIHSLREKPMFATSAERFLIMNELKSSYKELPQPLRFSKILSTLLSRVSTPLEEYDLIAGRIVDRELSEEEERMFQIHIVHPDYPTHRIFWPSGHCAYSWDAVVRKGLVGLREIALDRMKEVDTEGERTFLRAVIETYDAIIAYTLRYAEAARVKGMNRLADTLTRVATEKPSDFVTALQLLWIITLIDCSYVSENPTLTVGRLDQILYPLYQKDLARGVLTKEEAKEYITDYYCKHNLIMGRGEHQVGDPTNSTTFRRIANFDAPQYLLLAGTDERGELAVNELTELFAECIVPAFKNPVVVVRYVKDMDKSCPALWKTLCERALASSSLMFYNDENVLAALLRLGLPEEDARRYIHFGCNWCSPGDNSAWMVSSPQSKHYDTVRTPEEAKALDIPYMRTRSKHSWPEDFVEVMRELSQREGESVTIEDFYDGFFARMSEFIDRKLAYLSRELSVRKRNPSSAITFGDCFFTDSVKNAQCFTAGAKYHFELQAFQMFGTVVDCFIAVDQLVFIEKKLTLKELMAAVDADFEGYPHVLALCRKAEKYGMDTELSNRHVERLSRDASRLVIEKNRPYFEKEKLFLVPCMQSDTWHLKYGEGYGATPDGRRAYTPYSQNIRPANGVAVNGLSAMLQSVLHLPKDGLVSGALNLDLDPKQFEGENGRAAFCALFASYLNRGGLHAQVSCADVKDLIDAKEHPEDHRDLLVRVTGYSGVFVDMCERLQNDVIERLK